jgi:flavin reductase (DIM6/NTAB) family NADH-FMN oxidoreductase RutF
MAFDMRAYREALGSFPTGVAVVTAAPSADAGHTKVPADAGQPKVPADAGKAKVAAASHVGITVNSFTSVSLDPPLVLWCMDRKSGRHDLFAKAGAFTVNILGTEHEGVSARLARPGEHALDGIELVATELGPPGLADSLAVFECITERTWEAGDHTILLGRVVRFSRPATSAPLVYFGGRYSALAPELRGRLDKK